MTDNFLFVFFLLSTSSILAERVLALQALKTLGRATEGCDSIFTEEVGS